MSRQIADVVLFFSQYSRKSDPCVQLVIQAKLPIMLIPLDTTAIREAALNGSNIQIRSVPSMVVEYTDRNVQLYVGSPKIVSWLNGMIERQRSSPQPNYQASTTLDDNDSSSDEGVSTSTSSSEEEAAAKSKSSHKKHRYQRPSSDPKTPVDLIFQDDEHLPVRPPVLLTKGLLIGPDSNHKSSNANLVSMAKKMMADRERTLGYKDKGDT